MDDQTRKRLRRANTLVAGLILQAKHATDPETLRTILSEALLTYALLTPFEP